MVSLSNEATWKVREANKTLIKVGPRYHISTSLHTDRVSWIRRNYTSAPPTPEKYAIPYKNGQWFPKADPKPDEGHQMTLTMAP